jgi:hypothetical protein
MGDTSLYFCVEPSLPLKHLRISQQIAIAENPLNASPFEAAANRSRL